MVPESKGTLLVRYRNKTIAEFGRPSHNSLEKLWVVVDVVKGKGSIPCPLEAAMAHTICVQGAQESMPTIGIFPPSLINRAGNPVLVWVEGLAETLLSCYQKGVLPFELSVPWHKTRYLPNLHFTVCRLIYFLICISSVSLLHEE